MLQQEHRDTELAPAVRLLPHGLLLQDAINELGVRLRLRLFEELVEGQQPALARDHGASIPPRNAALPPPEALSPPSPASGSGSAGAAPGPGRSRRSPSAPGPPCRRRRASSSNSASASASPGPCPKGPPRPPSGSPARSGLPRFRRLRIGLPLLLHRLIAAAALHTPQELRVDVRIQHLVQVARELAQPRTPLRAIAPPPANRLLSFLLKLPVVHGDGADEHHQQPGFPLFSHHNHGHSPVNSGGRFSRNARTPSARSLVVCKSKVKSVSNRNACSNGCPAPRLMASFANRVATGPREAITSASRLASPAASPATATAVTSPACNSASASNRSAPGRTARAPPVPQTRMSAASAIPAIPSPSSPSKQHTTGSANSVSARSSSALIASTAPAPGPVASSTTTRASPPSRIASSSLSHHDLESAARSTRTHATYSIALTYTARRQRLAHTPGAAWGWTPSSRLSSFLFPPPLSSFLSLLIAAIPIPLYATPDEWPRPASLPRDQHRYQPGHVRP